MGNEVYETPTIEVVGSVTELTGTEYKGSITGIR
jgi:hypothetical protein